MLLHLDTRGGCLGAGLLERKKTANCYLILNFFGGGHPFCTWSEISIMLQSYSRWSPKVLGISLKCCCFQNTWLEGTCRSLIKVSFCSSFVNILGDYADSIFNISEHLSALLVEFLQHKPPLLSSLELTLFTGNWGILAKKTALTEPTECSYSTSWIFFSNILHIFEVYNFYAFWILWI